MKPLLLVLVALILLGGGGAGAYFYFKQPAEAASGAAGEVAKADNHKKHDASKSAFVQLDPLILPVIGQDGLSHVVSLVVVIETRDEAGKQSVTHMSPRLKDAFIQDMYGALYNETMMRDGIIQVTPLKNRLHKVSEKVMGEGIVSNVLLQVVQQRPM